MQVSWTAQLSHTKNRKMRDIHIKNISNRKYEIIHLHTFHYKYNAHQTMQQICGYVSSWLKDDEYGKISAPEHFLSMPRIWTVPYLNISQCSRRNKRNFTILCDVDSFP